MRQLANAEYPYDLVSDKTQTRAQAQGRSFLNRFTNDLRNESAFMEVLRDSGYNTHWSYFLANPLFDVSPDQLLRSPKPIVSEPYNLQGPIETPIEVINLQGGLKREVDALLESAGHENWDGEDALPVTQDIVNIAHEVIEKLPLESVILPDVEATPQGEIDFDWVLDRNTMLTISIGPGGVIAFAGTCTEGNIRGQKEWAGKLPHFIGCWFECIEGE